MAMHRINVIGYHGASSESLRRLELELEARDRDELLAAAEQCVCDRGYRTCEGESRVRFDYGDGSYCIDVPVLQR